MGGDFAARLVVPLKKGPDGQFTDRRVTTDLRDINSVTIPDHYSLPFSEDLMRRVVGCRFISKCDFLAGFFQMKVHPKDQHKLAFWWGNRLMCWKRMPMGAKNATAYFQRVIDKELARAGLSDVAVAFVDDLLILQRLL